MKRLLTLLILLLIVLTSTAQQPKYIFYFIGDGLGINHIRGTEIYNATIHPEMENGGRLSFTRFPIRTFIENHSSSSYVTDSSAAATALASGVKTVNGYMGVDANKVPAKNIAEVVVELGMKVGVASNVAVNHATPGAFYAHNESRSQYGEIFEDLLDSKIDFAAGSTILCRKKSGKTPQDYVEMAKEAGIQVVQNPKDVKKIRKKRVLLLSENLGRQALKYANDCEEGDFTIVDYTKTAIDYLERESTDKGFFLMVEAGHIDYCAHDNDAVTTFSEINHLSDAVSLALDFYKKYPEQTLIIVTADHETGGMALGYKDYKMVPERLGFQKCSVVTLTQKMQDMRAGSDISWESMAALLTAELGFWDSVTLRKKDEKALRDCFEKNFLESGEKVVSLYNHNEKMASLAVNILNKRARINWISLDHTGMQVPLFVKGAGIEHFYECYDNTDVPKSIAKALGTTLEN